MKNVLLAVSLSLYKFCVFIYFRCVKNSFDPTWPESLKHWSHDDVSADECGVMHDVLCAVKHGVMCDLMYAVKHGG